MRWLIEYSNAYMSEMCIFRLHINHCAFYIKLTYLTISSDHWIIVWFFFWKKVRDKRKKYNPVLDVVSLLSISGIVFQNMLTLDDELFVIYFDWYENVIGLGQLGLSTEIG